MKTVFMTGTAGSGKSLLTSKLHEYYTGNGAFCAVLNLDPGVEETPYTPDIDVRDHVDLVSIMKKFELGPNGALVMANDMIATKADDINEQIRGVNPDYLLVDTPGQVELFAYRSSGPFLADRIGEGDGEKSMIFLFDGVLVTTPANFVSMTFLAASIRLRIKLPTINVMTKTDIIGKETADRVLEWSSEPGLLDAALSGHADGETFVLNASILRGTDINDLVHGLIPVSNTTGDGMVSLESALSRTINQGEEVED